MSCWALGFYSVSDESFVPTQSTQSILQNGKEIVISKESGHPVEWMKEENYKFKLSQFQEPLIKWLETSPAGNTILLLMQL